MRTTAPLYSTLRFNETQKFTQKWIWVILIGTFLACSGVIVAMVMSNPASSWPLMFMIFIPVMVLGLMYYTRLETSIDSQGIHVTYKPFIWNTKLIAWKDIQTAQVREYAPIREFGGWGIRYTFRKGKAYNISGNMGIQLELKNGKRLLIGTQKPELAQAQIDKYFVQA